MTVLVTGATGTVGAQVVKALALAGVKCRAAVRSREKAARWSGSSVDVADFDFEKPATFAPALAGVQKVFLLELPRPDQAAVTGPFIQAARAAGVKHIVKLSGLSAGEEKPLMFGIWHRDVEKLLEASGIAWTHLRPNSFMQNYITYYGDMIRKQSTIYLPQNNGKVSLVDVRDIAAMAAAALTRPGHAGRAYRLTGPAAVSNHEIAEILTLVVGRRITYISVPDDAARHAMKGMEFPSWLIEAMVELYNANRDGKVAAVFDDIPNVLGRPATNFEQFAQDHAASFR